MNSKIEILNFSAVLINTDTGEAITETHDPQLIHALREIEKAKHIENIAAWQLQLIQNSPFSVVLGDLPKNNAELLTLYAKFKKRLENAPKIRQKIAADKLDKLKQDLAKNEGDSEILKEIKKNSTKYAEIEEYKIELQRNLFSINNDPILHEIKLRNFEKQVQLFEVKKYF